MKKFAIALVVLSLFVVSSAFAEINYGIQGGLDFASYENAEGDNTYAPGINVGAVATMDITDFVSEYVTVEKVLARANVGFAYFKPASDEIDFTAIGGGKIDIDYSMSTLYIEVLGQYYINDKTYALLGLGLAPYSMSAEVSGGGGFEAEGETKFGPIIGAGYHFNDKLAAEVSAGTAQIRINTIYFF